MIKNFLKKFWRLGVILIVGALMIATTLQAAPQYFALPLGQPGCDEPILWKLEKIDERFPLSQQDFLTTTFKAQMLWEKTLGKKLFVYDQNSDFELQTNFDERQEMTYEGQDLDEKYTEYEEKKTSLKQQYDSLKIKYDELTMQYEKISSDFEKDIADYEKDVKKWNKLGGAPVEIFDDLEKEKERLEKIQKKLNEMGDEINSLTKQINALATQLNIHAESINKEIETFKEKYGEPQPFIQGLYAPPLDNITIFQFKEKNDLLLVLMHEFGHALGIEEHVEEPKAIMHYLMNEQDIVNPQITSEDISAYNAICTPRVPTKKEAFISYLIYTPWEEMNIKNIFKISR